MEIRVGFKQTEVGAIPDDWEVKPLHTLSEKIMVGIASAATHAYRDRGVVMFRNQNIKPGYLNDSDLLYIDEGYEAAFRNKRLKSGDLLTARTGYPGTTSIVPQEYEGAQSFTTLITRPRRNAIDPKYLCCFINSEAGQKYFDENQIGGGQKNVNAGSLKYLPVPFPPTKAEQEAIANALSDADALIESLEQLLTKKRQIKQGAMQELLTGKRRLPGFSEKWEPVVLGDLFTFKNGLNKAKHFFGHGTPIANYMDVYGQLEIRQERLKGKVAVNEQEKLNYGLKCGDVLFTRTSETVSEIGTSSVVIEELSDTVFSGFLLRARPKQDKLCNEFKKYCFQSESVRSQIVSTSSYTTRALTNGRLLSTIILKRPNMAEQFAIATILSDMDAELAALEAKLAKARHLKQGMMQVLLTGQIRLV